MEIVVFLLQMWLYRIIKIHTVMLVFIGVTVLSCRSVKGYNSRPKVNNAYTGDDNSVDMDVFAYHVNDSLTRIYYRIHTENLMFKRMDSSQTFYAEVFVACKLLPDINSRHIIDSISRYITKKFPEGDEPKIIEGSFGLKLKQSEFSYLDFWIIDKNKNLKHSYPISVIKSNRQVEQNYLLFDKSGLAYKNTFFSGEEIRIVSDQNKGKTVLVDCYFKEFGIALPPFSTQKSDELKYKPDSIFNLTINDQAFLTMPPKGFYHLRSDQTSNDGLSIFTYEKSYPGVNNIDEMINCTRYIMSKEEFQNCKYANDQKACIDNFWLSLAGSNERAKELLRKYYMRVKEANKKYTSYIQGWKTDRGMISIIFGEPVNIYKSKNEEVWIYGQEVDMNSLKFVFKQTENPFSANDYILQRSYLYKEPWYAAVDYWRQGRMSLEK